MTRSVIRWAKSLLPRRLQLSIEERGLYREYRTKLEQAKDNREHIEEVKDWYSDVGWGVHVEQRLLTQRKLIRKAEALGAYIPSKPSEDDNEHWFREQWTEQWLLTDQGVSNLRREIRRARKEIMEFWTPWISLLIALFGSIASVLSVWLAWSSK